MSTSLSSYTVILVNGRQPRASGARKFRATRVSTLADALGNPCTMASGSSPARGSCARARTNGSSCSNRTSRPFFTSDVVGTDEQPATSGQREEATAVPGRGSASLRGVTGASARTREHAAATPPGVGRLRRDRRLGQIGPGMSGQSESKLRPVAGITPRLQPAAVHARPRGRSPARAPTPVVRPERGPHARSG